MNKASINISRATQFLFFLLICLIPFPIRHVFDSAWNFQTGAYSDFTSLSLYISDLVLVALVVLMLLFHRKWKIPKVWKYSGLIAGAWLILELFVASRATLPLQAYFSLRFLFLIVFAASVSQINVSREKLAWLFSFLGFLESLIAIFQFYTQHSLGLYKLGESHLSASTFGVAKIVSHGTTLIRGYGTFPHSNLLGAFLVVCVLLNLYLLAITYQKPRGENLPRGKFSRETIQHAVLWLLLALNSFGLFISLSRAAILGLAAGLLVILVYIVVKKMFSHIFKLFLPLGVILLIWGMTLFPYLASRSTISDNSTKERLFYNQLGLEMVKNKPIFGFGPGTSVLHMKQYAQDFKQTILQPWEIQPIHNFYLITWAEWGLGAIPVFILLIYPVIGLFKREKDIWNMVLLAIAAAFAVMFLFDHYFYTIWPTQLLLWLLIGLSFHVKHSNPDSDPDYL